MMLYTNNLIFSPDRVRSQNFDYVLCGSSINSEKYEDMGINPGRYVLTDPIIITHGNFLLWYLLIHLFTVIHEILMGIHADAKWGGWLQVKDTKEHWIPLIDCRKILRWPTRKNPNNSKNCHFQENNLKYPNFWKSQSIDEYFVKIQIIQIILILWGKTRSIQTFE